MKQLMLEEEPWSERIEEYIWDVKRDAETRSENHKHEGDTAEFKYYLISIPPIVVSGLISFFGNFIPEEQIWVIQLLSMFVTVGNALALFLNYGDKSATHYAFEKSYQVIVSMINLEMSRSPKYRRVADVFTNEIRLRMEFLNQQAPEISKFECCGRTSMPENSLYALYKKNDNITLDMLDEIELS